MSHTGLSNFTLNVAHSLCMLGQYTPYLAKFSRFLSRILVLLYYAASLTIVNYSNVGQVSYALPEIISMQKAVVSSLLDSDVDSSAVLYVRSEISDANGLVGGGWVGLTDDEQNLQQQQPRRPASPTHLLQLTTTALVRWQLRHCVQTGSRDSHYTRCESRYQRYIFNAKELQVLSGILADYKCI